MRSISLNVSADRRHAWHAVRSRTAASRSSVRRTGDADADDVMTLWIPSAGTAQRLGAGSGRFHGASLQCAKCRSPAVCTGIRPACYNTPAAGAGGESLHSVGLTCHRVGKVVLAALGSPDELVDRLTDTSANVLILFGARWPRFLVESNTRWRSAEANRGASQIARPAPTHAPVSSPITKP